MKKLTKTVYISTDGREFFTEEDCLMYETGQTYKKLKDALNELVDDLQNPYYQEDLESHHVLEGYDESLFYPDCFREIFTKLPLVGSSIKELEDSEISLIKEEPLKVLNRYLKFREKVNAKLDFSEIDNILGGVRDSLYHLMTEQYINSMGEFSDILKDAKSLSKFYSACCELERKIELYNSVETKLKSYIINKESGTFIDT